MEYVAIGRIGKSRGVKGDFYVNPLTKDFKRFELLKTIYVNKKTFNIERLWYYKNKVVLKLETINNPDDVDLIKGFFIEIPETEVLSLEKDEYYIYQLIGMTVYADDKEVGKITEVLELPANDVYIIKNVAGEELVIPAIKDVVLDVDIENKIMKVHLLEGL